MRHSSLEIDLQNLKDSKCKEFDEMYKEESLKIEDDFKSQFMELEKNFKEKFNTISSSYSREKFNITHKDSNLIHLKAVSDAKKDLELQLLTHFSSYFVEIIENLITDIEEILQISIQEVTLSHSELMNKEFSKLKKFKKTQISEDLEKFEVIFSYNDELIRFNLKEEIRKIINNEIEDIM